MGMRHPHLCLLWSRARSTNQIYEPFLRVEPVRNDTAHVYNVNNNQTSRKITFKPMPDIKITFSNVNHDDVRYLSNTLPDLTHHYTERGVRNFVNKIDLGKYKTYINHLVLAISMILILVIRSFPRLISIPLILILTYASVTNGCGLVLVLYIITDTFFWLIRGRKHVCPYTAPISHPSKDPWWTKELNGLILLLLLMTIGGCATGAFSTEIMYVCYVVVVVLVFATAFPTNGQNSGINSLIITISTVCLILFISGAGTSIIDTLVEYYIRSKISRTERAEVVDDVITETDAWREFSKALGNWDSSFFFTPMSINILEPWACLRYIIGTAYLYSLVIGNFQRTWSLHQRRYHLAIQINR